MLQNEFQIIRRKKTSNNKQNISRKYAQRRINNKAKEVKTNWPRKIKGSIKMFDIKL